MTKRKPMLNENQMIKKLKQLGIRFNIKSESEAKEILSKNSYFFKLGYFRKNFPKKNERYNVEFAYLSDLASIDMQLRYLLIHMCLDIEHSLKVYILNKISNSTTEDGYSIMNDFYKNEAEKARTFRNVMQNKKKNIPRREFDKYYTNPPIWVCLELMSYNQFCEFVEFYYTRSGDNYLNCARRLIRHVKNIRNMSAHSQPIISNLGYPKLDKTNRYLTEKGQEKSNLTFKQVQYRPIRDIFSTFYTHQLYCSKGIKSNRMDDMNEFKKRLNRHNYYNQYSNLAAVINGINKIIDNYKAN